MGTPIDRDKMRSIGVISKRTRDRVRTGRDEQGRYKATTDELNNTVTERDGNGATGVSNRQDVEIRPPTIKLKLSQIAGE